MNLENSGEALVLQNALQDNIKMKGRRRRCCGESESSDECPARSVSSKIKAGQCVCA